MTIPVLIPPVTPELSQPYLTADGFRAYPHWLDLDNLIPGGVQALQDDELADVLLTASRWAVDQVDQMPLHGHYVRSDNQRCRVGGRTGRIYLHPRDVPVRGITSLSWGYEPQRMQAVTLPEPSLESERGRQISFIPNSTASPPPGPRCRPWPRPGSWVFVDWSYIAAWPTTVLAASCIQGAGSVEVTDPTSVLPGDALRIYDTGSTSSAVGANETVYVASGYAPAVPAVPPVPTVIPIAGTTSFAHKAGTMITNQPRTVMQAVICCAIALLMREDVSAEEPASQYGIAARTGTGSPGHAGGLINDAIGYLEGHLRD